MTNEVQNLYHWEAEGDDGDKVSYDRGTVTPPVLQQLVQEHLGENVEGIERPVSLEDGETIFAVFQSFYPNPKQQYYTNSNFYYEPIPGTVGPDEDILY